MIIALWWNRFAVTHVKRAAFHFARHKALVAEGPGVDVRVLDPGEG